MHHFALYTSNSLKTYRAAYINGFSNVLMVFERDLENRKKRWKTNHCKYMKYGAVALPQRKLKIEPRDNTLIVCIASKIYRILNRC